MHRVIKRRTGLASIDLPELWDAKAERVLGWKVKTKFAELVKLLCEAER